MRAKPLRFALFSSLVLNMAEERFSFQAQSLVAPSPSKSGDFLSAESCATSF